ncbi:uncharacterized protein LOC129003016 [Macrosteles quadrilineatus]|uniref:uncharacterized protein LOC129003016 n=1 Tax=Macrosteles quadrilineatus TaxID=74068 RepID=UPI0023E2A7FF|nr:uncharacterized protein LOC129003016 [Macrosteles quadrilineatus]XP_054287185.1 uncharacterized protein LOC129003016 [Macrosteles quadrilineatus]
MRSLPSTSIQTFVFLVTLCILQLTTFRVFQPKKCECDVNTPLAPVENVPDWEKTLNFTGFNNETGTPDGHYIIPNYVHFVKFRYDSFNFIHFICVLAAFKHQRPEKLFIHTDVEEFRGKYWQILLQTPGFREVLILNRIQLRQEVFGQPLNPEWRLYHGGDVARLEIMRKYGGIYVDNDSYLIRSLDDLRRYEMVVAWRPGKAMMNQVVLAHKDARLLREWHEGYRDYKPEHWYYNAGRQPANVLLEKPYLAHSLRDLLGTYDIRKKIYTTKWDSWKTYYSCHLMSRWMENFRGVRYPNPITEKDVLRYDNTLQEMVQDVYDVRGVKQV